MTTLLTARELAKELAVSQRTVWKLLSGGRLPGPLRIGRSVRWRAEQISEWCRLGCPPRDEFEAATGGDRRAGR